MGDKFLNCLPEEGDKGNQSPPLSYTDIFEQQFPHYLAIGMTPDAYWNGDNDLPKAYREADKLRLERDNFQSWLHGKYIYDALLAASPLLNGMSKRNEPFPYLESPYEFKDQTHDKESEREKERQEYLSEKNKIEMMLMKASARFAQRRKEGEKNGG